MPRISPSTSPESSIPSETRRFEPTYATGIDGSGGGGFAGFAGGSVCAEAARDNARPTAIGSSLRSMSLSRASLETRTPAAKYRRSVRPTGIGGRIDSKTRGVSCAPRCRTPAMPLAAATRDRIDQLLAANRVVLFMKGTRQGPQCGFSAAAVDRLDTLLDDYATVDVLSD